MKPRNKIWFREEGHSYFADEQMTKRIPGYSAIMAEVYGDKFARVPRSIREEALKIGNSVHLETQIFDQEQLYIHNPSGYLEQWKRFKKDAGIEKFDLIELPLFNKKDWYCCTLDRLCIYKDILCDIKTGRKYKEHKIQTAAQSDAVYDNFGIRVKTRINVYLTEYAYSVDFHDDENDFVKWKDTVKQFQKKVYGI